MIGILTDKVSWRWIFYVNLPTVRLFLHGYSRYFLSDCFYVLSQQGGLAFAILFFSLKLNPHKTATLKSIASTFDFLGLFLILVGVVCLLVGFNNGQSSWGSAETIALLVVGVLSLAAAGYVEMVTKKSAIIPPRLFKTRTTTCILLLVYCHAFGFIAGSCKYSTFYILGIFTDGSIVSVQIIYLSTSKSEVPMLYYLESN